MIEFDVDGMESEEGKDKCREKEYFRQECKQQAAQLHRENAVVDAHLDLPGEILIRKNNGECDIVKNYYLANWKKAGINIIFASVFVESSMLPEMGLRNALNQIAVMKAEIRENEELMLITSGSDVKCALETGKIGIILYAEGLDFIGNDISLLETIYDLGVRGAALTWSRSNLLGVGCCKASECQQKYGSLTSFGIQVVEKMENMGMFLDVSHLNDDGFKEISIIARKPFIATHSCSRSVHFSYRNLTDEQLGRIAAQDGIVGLNSCKLIVGVKNGEDPIEKMCEHIMYEVKLVGADYVGLGLDLCDSYECARYKRKEIKNQDDCLKNHAELLLLTARLLEYGMDEKDIIKIIGGNFVKYLLKML